MLRIFCYHATSTNLIFATPLSLLPVPAVLGAFICILKLLLAPTEKAIFELDIPASL